MIGYVISVVVVVLFYFGFDLIIPPRGEYLKDWIQGIDYVAERIPPLWPLPLTRRGKLRALRTMELWAWWSGLRQAYSGREVWVGKSSYDCEPGRPAIQTGYRGKSSDYLYLDKFDRDRVADSYAGNVGGYTREELQEMIK